MLHDNSLLPPPSNNFFCPSTKKKIYLQNNLAVIKKYANFAHANKK